VSTIQAGILACCDAAASRPFHRIIRDAAALGMTGKAPGAPCKRCLCRFDSGLLHLGK